ncbi:MAG: metallophosphoesterase family protein [Candidatus Omnitrophota bacterium]
MIRIAVVSDTHSRKIPAEVVSVLKKADMIVHAGDVCDAQTLKAFEKIGEVKAVCGNMDEGSIRKKLPERCFLDIGEIRVGVMHGEGSPDMVLKRIVEEFAGEDVDVVVFGHSHKPCTERVGGILYINPGSLTDDIFAPYRSYALLEVEGKTVNARIVRVS